MGASAAVPVGADAPVPSRSPSPVRPGGHGVGPTPAGGGGRASSPVPLGTAEERTSPHRTDQSGAGVEGEERVDDSRSSAAVERDADFRAVLKLIRDTNQLEESTEKVRRRPRSQLQRLLPLEEKTRASLSLPPSLLLKDVSDDAAASFEKLHSELSLKLTLPALTLQIVGFTVWIPSSWTYHSLFHRGWLIC